MLDKQIVRVPFTGKLDQKTDSNMLEPINFAVLENCVRRKIGRVEKRDGLMRATGGDIPTGSRSFIHKSDLVAIGGSAGSPHTAYSYSPARGDFITRGSAWHTLLTDKAIKFSTSFDQARYDCAYASGVVCFVWKGGELGTTALYYTLIDETTQTVIVDATQLASTGGVLAKVVAVGSRFLIMWIDGTDLKAQWVGAQGGAGSPSVIEASVGTLFDISMYDTSSAVWATATAANAIKIGYIGISAAYESQLPTTVTIATRGDACLTVLGDAIRGTVLLGYASTGGGEANTTHVRIFDYILNQLGNEEIDATSAARNITCFSSSPSASSNSVYYTLYELSSPRTLTMKTVLTLSADSTTFTEVSTVLMVDGLGLASKIIRWADGSIHGLVTLAYESSLQSFYLIYDTEGNPVAKYFYGTGGGLTRGNNSAGLVRSLVSGLASPARIDSLRIMFPLQVAARLQANEDGTTFSDTYNVVGIVTEDANSYQTAQLGDSSYIAGSVVGQYDGTSIVEAGFHIYPETVSAAATGSGGSLSAGTYYVSAIYEWTDANGDVHRSAPSAVDTQVAILNDTINVTVPTLRITRKTDPNRKVKIVVYRSLVDDPTILYRDNVAVNNTGTSTITVALTQADITLATKEILYTTGGVIENIGFPACNSIANHGNRLFMAGLENPNNFTFTKLHSPGIGASYTDAFVKSCEAVGGGVEGCGSLDDKLVLFKRDRLYTLPGQGPLDTGAQDDYVEPQLHTADVGTTQVRSIESTPLGLVFKSDKGFYLLDRGLGIKYIGAAVEDYNSLTTTSVVTLNDTNEIRFIAEDGPTLVYNYYFDEWCVFNGFEASSAVAHPTLGFCLIRNGYLHTESSTDKTDNGVPYKIAMETAWLALAGLQGYQRIWRISCMGHYIGAHFTKVSLAYDRENVFNEIKYFDTRDAINGTTFGQDGVFGTGGFGTGSLAYSWRLKPARQKCEAIKIRIEDVDSLDVGAGSAAFNGLALEIGVKKTTDKKSAVRSI